MERLGGAGEQGGDYLWRVGGGGRQAVTEEEPLAGVKGNKPPRHCGSAHGALAGHLSGLPPD